MENSIVRDFQNLRVFSNGNIIIMDHLVKDLTTALDESSQSQKTQVENVAPGSLSRRAYKKRRGKKRRPDPWQNCGTISEASESSIEDRGRNVAQMSDSDRSRNIAQMSDSDDILISKHMHRLSVPVSDAVPQVESDSVTESFSPTRPQRRRRKYRNMAVDPQTENETDTESMALQDSNVGAGGDVSRAMGEEEEGERFQPGKRKRSWKCRGEGSGCSGVVSGGERLERMEQGNYSQESSSLSSSETESDCGIMTNDEAREADDEQSDFFHEPGPVCGIPSILPWLDNERVTDEDMSSSLNFQRFISRTFNHLPRSSQLNFKARVSRLMMANGREIRVGRRKLKETIPQYSMTSYLQDREKWLVSGPYPPQLCNGAPPTNQTYDIKRQRKTPPPSPDYTEGSSKEGSLSRNRRLRDMSWMTKKNVEMSTSGLKEPIVKLINRHEVNCTLSDS